MFVFKTPSEIEFCAFGFLIIALLIMTLWFSQQKAARKLCLVVDGDVNEYSLKARDFLQSYANFNDVDKDLLRYQSLLDSDLRNEKIIVFCKIGARIEKIQETSILQLDNRFQNKILIFYIKSFDRLEYKILECRAEQKNLDANTDENVMTDALHAFLKIGSFERFKKWVFLMMLLSSAFVLFLPTLYERYDWSSNSSNLLQSYETESISEHEISKEVLIAKISRRYKIDYNEIIVNWSEEIVKNLRTEKKKIKKDNLFYQTKLKEISEKYEDLNQEIQIIRDTYISKHNEVGDLHAIIQQKERNLHKCENEVKNFILNGCTLSNHTQS